MPRLEKEQLRKVTQSPFNTFYFVRIGQEIYADIGKNHAKIEEEMRAAGMIDPVVDEGLITRLNDRSVLIFSLKPKGKKPTYEQELTDKIIEKIAGDEINVFDTILYNRQMAIREKNLLWCKSHRLARKVPNVFRPRTFMKP